jgi:hypothetical protein
MQAEARRFWRQKALLTAWRVNLSWTLRGFVPSAIGISAVFACVLLILRENGNAPAAVWGWYAGALVLDAAAAAGWMRRRFFSMQDALVRLEWHLGLRNRLSAALAGVGDFPPPQPVDDGYSIHWVKIIIPLCAGGALVAIAAALPITRRQVAFTPAAQPIAWVQTQSWIDTLKKSDALRQSPVEELARRLDQLRDQSPEKWYSQSSLEAGDNLRAQTAHSIEALDRDLKSAEDALAAMQQFSDGTPAAQLQAVGENLANTLKGLDLGALPLNRELLGKLQSIDPSQLKSLSPEELASLRERLKECDGVCKACLHPGELKDGDATLLVAAQGGTPGLTRGPGSVPLGLSEKPTGVVPSSSERLDNGDDLTRALPAELLGVSKSKPEAAAASDGAPTQGGDASNGAGGEAVFRNDLTPQEREVLKRFFK